MRFLQDVIGVGMGNVVDGWYGVWVRHWQYLGSALKIGFFIGCVALLDSIQYLYKAELLVMCCI